MKSTAVIGLLVVFGGLVLLSAVPVWLLWNGVLVNVVSGVSEVSFWQALGMTFLCSMLFKSYNTTAK